MATKAPITSWQPSEAARSAATDPTRMHDIVSDMSTVPEEYAMIGSGKCMEPLVPDGTLLVFDKREKPQRGDLVILWFKPQHIPAGQCQRMFKRLVMGPGPFSLPIGDNSQVEPVVIVEMLNPPRQLRVRGSHLLAMHKAVGVAKSNGDGTARYRPQRKTILAAIGDTMKRHNISSTRFGVEALEDPNLVFDMRNGRRLRAKTEARVRAYIASLDQGGR